MGGYRGNAGNVNDVARGETCKEAEGIKCVFEGQLSVLDKNCTGDLVRGVSTGLKTGVAGR